MSQTLHFPEQISSVSTGTNPNSKPNAAKVTGKTFIVTFKLNKTIDNLRPFFYSSEIVEVKSRPEKLKKKKSLDPRSVNLA